MKPSVPSISRKARQAKADAGRPSIGIRELKAKASAIIEDVKGRRVTYAVTKRGVVEALIMPVDAGERLQQQPPEEAAWETWLAATEAGQEPAGDEPPYARDLATIRGWVRKGLLDPASRTFGLDEK